MGLFRRRSGQVTPPDPSLPMFGDGDRAARFVALAQRVFAENGLECRYDDGALLGADGGAYGLGNVAANAARTPERGWRSLLNAHVRGLQAAHATPKERDLEQVRNRLYLKLWALEDVPLSLDEGPVREPFGADLVGLPAIDHPEYVETMAGQEDIELLGGWDIIRPIALGNLAALHGEEIATLGEDASAQVQISIGGFFNASRVFTMPHLLRQDFLLESPDHGVLFVVPNRHLVGVHPLAGPGMVAAAATMLQVATGEHDGPGAISPHLWFWRDGVVQQVSHPDPEGGMILDASGPLAEAMREIGLLQ